MRACRVIPNIQRPLRTAGEKGFTSPFPLPPPPPPPPPPPMHVGQPRQGGKEEKRCLDKRPSLSLHPDGIGKKEEVKEEEEEGFLKGAFALRTPP